MSAPLEDGGPYAGPPRYDASNHGQPQYGPPGPQQWGQPQLAPQPWGQPQSGQPQWGQPQWGQPQWGQPPWGQPPWGLPPGPQRPGSVIAAAVLAFASAVLVLVGTVYAMAFSALLSLARGPDAGMGPVVALLQLGLAGLLVAGGLRVLHGTRWWLLGAAAGQLAMTVYWLVVLDDVAPATVDGTVLALPLLYGALAVVAAGLTFLPDARAWTAPAPATPSADAGV